MEYVGHRFPDSASNRLPSGFGRCGLHLRARVHSSGKRIVRSSYIKQQPEWSLLKSFPVFCILLQSTVPQSLVLSDYEACSAYLVTQY